MARIDIGLNITGVNNATAAIRGATSDVKNLGDNAQATSNRLKAIQVVLAGIIVEKTLEWSKALIAAASSAQNADIRMVQFAGSASAAAKVVDDLVGKFAATPYSLDNIGAGWLRLQSAIGNNDKTTKVISAITNDVAALGGKDENIDNLSESFQRLYARGYASSREFVSILEQTGLTLGDLAKGAGQTGQQFSRNLQSGLVSADAFTAAFVNASKGRFGDYAQYLKSTIAGAMGNVSNTIKVGFSSLGSNTTLNASIAGTLNYIADAIKRIMGSINQQTIDHFFDWLAKVAPLAIQTGRSLLSIAGAVLTFSSTIINFLGSLPPEVVTYGIVGYAFFGKLGAATFGIIGGQLAKLSDQTQFFYQQVMKLPANGDRFGALVDMLNKAQPDNKIQNWFKATEIFGFAAAGKLKNDVSPSLQEFAKNLGVTNLQTTANAAELVKWKKAIDDAKTGLDKLASYKPGQGAASPGTSPAAQQALEAAQAATQKLKDLLAGSVNEVTQLRDQTNGNTLGANIDALVKKNLDFNKSIDSAITAEKALKDQLPQNVALVKQLGDEKKAFTAQTVLAISKLKQEYDIETKIFQVQQQGLQLQNEIAVANLKIASDNSSQGNLLKGTSVVQASLQVMQQAQQYQQQLNSLTSTYLQTQQQITDLQRNPSLSADDQKRLTTLQTTLSTTQDLGAATRNALNGLSVSAQLTNQYFQQIGQTMENDLGNGIAGLINGTASWGDLARSVITDLVNLSVKLLLQFAEMELFQTTASAAAIATAAPTAAAMAALWGPAAISASIATLGAADISGVAAYQAALATSLLPFKDGGVPGLGAFSSSIVSGPTTFGIMGEAGTEAVMPLTRIGGKLGVRSEGGGGDHFHLHLNAIDPQTGADFLLANIDTIGAGLAKQVRLNRKAA